jgi:hypothetical protein
LLARTTSIQRAYYSFDLSFGYDTGSAAPLYCALLPIACIIGT